MSEKGFNVQKKWVHRIDDQLIKQIPTYQSTWDNEIQEIILWLKYIQVLVHYSIQLEKT